MKRDSLLKILRLLLRPAASFCVKHGFTIREALELLKVELIQKAQEEMEINNQKSNTSRLAVITGIHRRDVTRLVETAEPDFRVGTNFLERILTKWEQDQSYCNKAGRPRTLGCAGTNNEFRNLVEAVSRDLNSGTILFELERLNLVERKNEKVRLKSSALLIEDNQLAGWSLLGLDMNALYSAVYANLESSNSLKHLHAHTEFDNVRVSALPTIQKWLVTEGTKFHKRLRDYLSKFDTDFNKQGQELAGAKVMVGTFSFCSSKEDEID